MTESKITDAARQRMEETPAWQQLQEVIEPDDDVEDADDASLQGMWP